MRKTILYEIALFIIVVAVFALIAGPGDFTQALLFISDAFIKMVFVLLKF